MLLARAWLHDSTPSVPASLAAATEVSLLGQPAWPGTQQRTTQ